MPELYVYADPSRWGREVANAAGRAGIPVVPFHTSKEVPSGAVAFVRLDQYKDRRNRSKELVRELAGRGVRTLPSLQDAELYDDKAAQYEVLQQFLPETVIIRSASKAASMAGNLTYPLVSKSIVGASSANVRLLPNLESAMAEVQQVFSGRGMPINYGRKQREYVYWQRFVPDNPCDYRVTLVGDYGWGLVRENRPDVPFASGSGVGRPLTLETERERAAFQFGWQVKDHLKSEMVALDVVFDGDEPRLLEVSFSWTSSWHVLSPVFDRNGERTKYTRGWQWDLIVLVLKRMLDEDRRPAPLRN